jgi:tripartite motif-containing protein 71
MRRIAPAAVLAALTCAVLAPSVALATPCAGATNCPWATSQVIGIQGQGTLRFPQAVARGFDGRVYVGDVFTHEVEVFNANGTFDEDWGTNGTGAGQFGAIGGITVGKNGSVYVADSGNRIERFTLDGGYLGSFGSSGSGLGQLDFGSGGTNASPAGGGVSIDGNYLFVADSLNNRVERFDLDGSNPFIIGAGQLKDPQGLYAVAGKVVVADNDNQRLAFFSDAGQFLRAIGTGPGNGPGQFQNPYDVTGDTHGDLYVADDLNDRIVRFGPQPAHAYLAQWGGFGSGLGQLEYPRALTADAAGDTWVADTANDRIQVFTPTGLQLQPPFGLNGRGPGEFTQPEGVGIDPSGIRAVADSIDGRVELLNPDGSVAALWGAPAPGPTLLLQPVAVAFDAAGNGYVVDQSRNDVVEFNRVGAIVRKIGAPGNGPGQMEAPSGIALDAAGNIYVADTGNGRIVRFAADGTAMPSIGTFTQIDSVAVTPDGSRIYGADSSTNRITALDPSGVQLARYGGSGKAAGHYMTLGAITLDEAGDLWTTERGGNRVQEINPTTGKGITSFGGRGSDPGEFVHPNGIAVGCSGTLTVSDTGANRVQAFNLNNPVVTPCVALPPVTSTPNLKLPTGPPAPPVELTFKLVHRLGLLKAAGISAVARCDQACTLVLSGTLTPTAAPRKHHKQVVVKLTPVTLKLLAGTNTTVRAPLTTTAVRTLTTALGHSRTMVLQLQVVATLAEVAPTVLTQNVNVQR